MEQCDLLWFKLGRLFHSLLEKSYISQEFVVVRFKFYFFWEDFFAIELVEDFLDLSEFELLDEVFKGPWDD